MPRTWSCAIKKAFLIVHLPMLNITRVISCITFLAANDVVVSRISFSCREGCQLVHNMGPCLYRSRLTPKLLLDGTSRQLLGSSTPPDWSRKTCGLCTIAFEAELVRQYESTYVIFGSVLAHGEGLTLSAMLSETQAEWFTTAVVRQAHFLVGQHALGPLADTAAPSY